MKETLQGNSSVRCGCDKYWWPFKDKLLRLVDSWTTVEYFVTRVCSMVAGWIELVEVPSHKGSTFKSFSCE